MQYSQDAVERMRNSRTHSSKHILECNKSDKHRLNRRYPKSLKSIHCGLFIKMTIESHDNDKSIWHSRRDTLSYALYNFQFFGSQIHLRAPFFHFTIRHMGSFCHGFHGFNLHNRSNSCAGGKKRQENFFSQPSTAKSLWSACSNEG